ncbi:hypothetical protein [Streptomyces sp. M10]|uniref:hypothetical protein n=1 Tax=Streptomyces sp. M10 TaxID=412968 RepID=UPI000645C4BE|nr:hypothetical protein [Streptomyces sp. M10]
MKRTSTAPRLVPYITQRECEYGGLEAELALSVNAFGAVRLAYREETAADRGPRGELWARCSQSLNASGRPAGRPQWRLVNSGRQREAMEQLRCQIGFCPAETDQGYIFLSGGAEDASRGVGAPVRTAQPPVCLKHLRLAVELCPHLRKGHVAFRARAASPWGVIGTRYRLTATGLAPLPADDTSMAYGHPQLGWFLASQLICELGDYEVVDLDDLVSAA